MNVSTHQKTFADVRGSVSPSPTANIKQPVSIKYTMPAKMDERSSATTTWKRRNSYSRTLDAGK